MGSLFFIILYLAVMSLSSLPLWREERLLFIRWATGPPSLASSLHDIFPGLPASVFGLFSHLHSAVSTERQPI